MSGKPYKEDHNRCKAALKVLTSKKIQENWSWPFMEPIDTTQEWARDYHKVVAHPMDLGTVKTKLGNNPKSCEYAAPKVFVKDVRLVFDNALLFNKNEASVAGGVYQAAQKLKTMFEEAIKEHFPAGEGLDRSETPPPPPSPPQAAPVTINGEERAVGGGGGASAKAVKLPTPPGGGSGGGDEDDDGFSDNEDGVGARGCIDPALCEAGATRRSHRAPAMCFLCKRPAGGGRKGRPTRISHGGQQYRLCGNADGCACTKCGETHFTVLGNRYNQNVWVSAGREGEFFPDCHSASEAAAAAERKAAGGRSERGLSPSLAPSPPPGVGGGGGGGYSSGGGGGGGGGGGAQLKRSAGGDDSGDTSAKQPRALEMASPGVGSGGGGVRRGMGGGEQKALDKDLHDCAWDGDVDAVKQLLANGATTDGHKCKVGGRS